MTKYDDATAHPLQRRDPTQARAQDASSAATPSWDAIRKAAAEGGGAAYVTTDAGNGLLYHVVLTRDRLEKLADGCDPGHDEQHFPHTHIYVGGDE